MSNFDNLHKAKNIFNDSLAFRSLKKRYIEATGSCNIDKYGKGFNHDDRFKSFSVQIYYSAYTGSYGNSSVGNFFRLDSNCASDALIEYLREHEDEVLEGIALILDKKAKKLVLEAKKELEKAENDLKKITNIIERESK